MKKIILISIAIAFSCVFIAAALLWRGYDTASGTQACERVQLTSQTAKENNEKRHYAFIVRYPHIVDSSDPRHQAFNRQAKALAMTRVDEFKQGIETPQTELFDTVVPNDLQIDYSVALLTDELISIGYAASSYWAGAAHPNHDSFVLNYDLKTGRTLQLRDLFKPQSDHLQVISDYAIEVLSRKLPEPLDKEWLQRGAAPDKDNYRNWLVTRSGLKVTFDPYQIASYAEGSHDVVVPYRVLWNIIAADGPLAAVATPGVMSPQT